MTQHDFATRRAGGYQVGEDRAPGDGQPKNIRGAVGAYAAGLLLATVLTIASFAVAAGWGGVWGPGIPMALVALAVGQMGVHLVFFLHITSGPDNTNNLLALAFGTLIVGLVMVGSLWIMANVSHHQMTPAEMTRIQR